jgi:flagellar biosynthetic protein FliO
MISLWHIHCIYSRRYHPGEAHMKCHVHAVNLLTLAVFLCLSIAAVRAEDEKPALGGFDINKVRELSTNPQNALQAGQAAAKPQKETPNYTFVILRIIGSLAIIIALIMFVSWLLRKAGLNRTTRIGGSGSMDVMEVLPLGQNRNMVLLRVMDTVYLCGQTPSSIALVDKIEGERAARLLTAGKGRSPVVQFKDAFNQFITKLKK